MNTSGNTGNRNTGDWNTGDSNTGHSNTGNRNTGNRNTGNWNTGNWNTGNWNTGNSNTGHSNTGNWNTCNEETGFFNTEEGEKIRIFNKPCSRKKWDDVEKPNFLFFSLTEWIPKREMSEREKEKNPSYKTTGGYLKEYKYKEAFQKSWNEASKEDQELVKKLPNFCPDIFYEISGIRVDEKTCEGREVEIDGVVYVLKKK